MDGGSPKAARRLSRGRILGSLAVLSLLVIVFLGREINDYQVRNAHFEPRIVLMSSFGQFKEGVIRSKCGDIPIPKLDEGEYVTLSLIPRPGCDYLIEGFTARGDELIELLERGRTLRRDVHIDFEINQAYVGLSESL
jgi:hypothetical protein